MARAGDSRFRSRRLLPACASDSMNPPDPRAASRLSSGRVTAPSESSGPCSAVCRGRATSGLGLGRPQQSLWRLATMALRPAVTALHSESGTLCPSQPPSVRDGDSDAEQGARCARGPRRRHPSRAGFKLSAEPTPSRAGNDSCRVGALSEQDGGVRVSRPERKFGALDQKAPLPVHRAVPSSGSLCTGRGPAGAGRAELRAPLRMVCAVQRAGPRCVDPRTALDKTRIAGARHTGSPSESPEHDPPGLRPGPGPDSHRRRLGQQ
jgi:hypothetical protein